MSTLPLTAETIRSAIKGDPSQLLYFLQRLNERCSSLQSIVDLQSKIIDQLRPFANPLQIARSAQLELTAHGHYPLQLEGLHGRTAEGQQALVPALPADPTIAANNIDANVYEVDTLYTFGGTFYRVAGGNPHTWEALTLSVALHNLLSATHGDSVAAAPVRGDLIVGNSTPKWARFARGAALLHLRMNAGGTDPEWAAIADAELSANVALLNAINTFSVQQVFNASATFNGEVDFASRTFTGTQTLSSTPFVGVDVSGGVATAKMPLAPNAGQWYFIVDYKSNAGTNNITLDGNGHNIIGAATKLISTNGGCALVFYTGSEWIGKVW